MARIPPLLLVLSLLLASAASGQTGLTRSVAACGGARAASGTKVMCSTLGQPAAAFTVSDSHDHGIGFWYDPVSSQVGVVPPAESRVLSLGPAVPNPFRSEAALTFSLAEPSRVTIRLFDVRGRVVRTLTDRDYTRGEYVVRVQGRGLPGGIYWCRMKVDERELSRRLVVLP